MINVLFFAVRELVGTDTLTLDASELPTVEAVRQQLAARGTAGRWRWKKENCWRRSTRR